MKYYFFLLLLILSSCDKEVKNINPDSYLNKSQQDTFKYKIIRYIQRLPKYASQETKFNSQFDNDYKKTIKECDLTLFYRNDEDTVYFAINKIAPSIKLKKTSTVGKLKFDANDSIIYYEEIFRTWKMEPKELQTKTKLLFMKLIEKEDLKPYYTVNSEPDFYIEFPDERTYFDTKKRVWDIKK